MNEDLTFEWGRHKAALNKRKHGVSFEEASSVFYDDNALEFDDPDHSEDEDRFIMLGLSFKTRMLVVNHCLRTSGTVIRIISSRKATKREAQRYWEEKT